MARTPTVTRQQILDTTIALINEEGPQAVTIRAIAGRLGKSTAPIYTQYPTMDDLMMDLSSYSIEALRLNTTKPRTRDSFLNIGLGFIDFA